MGRLFNTDMQRVIAEIYSESDPYRILTSWDYHKKHLKGIRCLISLEDYDSDLLPDVLQKKVFESKSKVFLQEFYKNSGLFYISNESLENFQRSNDFQFPIDYSLLLDSNYVGAIDLFFRGESLGHNYDSFRSSFFYIRKNRFNSDATPYLYENAEHIHERWDDVVRTFANYLRFSVAEPKGTEIKTVNDLYLPLNNIEAIKQAKNHLNRFYFGDKTKNALKEDLERRERFYYIVLSIIHIEHTTNGYLYDKFKKLVLLLHDEMAGIALRELLIGYLYFKNRNSVGILANLRKQINTAGSSAKAIANISWDFFFFRLMEEWATSTKMGIFFIPMFVTFDKRLAGLNEIYPIKMAFIHDAQLKVTMLPFDINKKIDDKDCNILLANYFKEDKVIARSAKQMPAIEDLKKECLRKERELDALFSVNIQR